MTTPRKGPVLIDRDEAAALTPESAPPVPDLTDVPTGQAMQTAAAIATRRGSALGRLFWTLATAFVGLVASVSAWDFVTGLLARNQALGLAALVLVVLLALVLAWIGLREVAAFARLRRIDDIRKTADAAHSAADLAAARRVVKRLEALYANRPDLGWGRDRMAAMQADLLDADALLGAAETALLAPLDNRVRHEIEAAARQVALVTAFVPLALADVAAALISNLRMIRRIAEIYGGRSGTFGSWRLIRSVLTHLAATGALAVGDDLIHSVAGGGLLSKLSRRFGEGVVNGALTARVGVAAMEVCRPLTFRAAPKPRVTALVQRALTGLFGRSDTAQEG